MHPLTGKGAGGLPTPAAITAGPFSFSDRQGRLSQLACLGMTRDFWLSVMADMSEACFLGRKKDFVDEGG